MAFNCAGFAEDLIASELFGYQRGAFTGATATKIGILETAHGGTVFMDEIERHASFDAREAVACHPGKADHTVGANKPIQLDIRFIAATNKNLKRAIEDGRFREDLYFRLNVVQITLPNLMERKEDIPILIRSFTSKYSRKFSKKISAIDSAAEKDSPGIHVPRNVRSWRTSSRGLWLWLKRKRSRSKIFRRTFANTSHHVREMAHLGGARIRIPPESP